MDWPGPVRTGQHNITAERIDENAHKVLRRLNQFGYSAYLVGGGVRDLLLEREPKDFDVSTDARPEEVRNLFRNCRLIGRRFRLAHILFSGRQIVEVSTFRAQPEDNGAGELITDDNAFGTPQSDAVRRDFTVNGLFYDYATSQVIDYVGGLSDLEDCTLRTIGEPATRFREDPVRILRAVKFAARLDFAIGAPEREAIRAERGELRKAAIPRILEEVLRMLWSGNAARSYTLLEELGVLELLLPEISSFINQPSDQPRRAVWRMLEAVDDRCGGQRNIENGVLLAALFWPPYRVLVDEITHNGETPHPRTLAAVARTIVGPASVRLRIARRDVASLMGALEAQYRFYIAHHRRRARSGFARSPHFPSALDLLDLRTEAESLPPSLHDAWHTLAAEHPPLPDFDDHPPRRRRRRR